MSYPAYPEYMDSGLDWLSDVPSHWKSKKIAWDLPYQVGWTPPSGNDKYYDGDLPWVTIADMTANCIEDTLTKITQQAVVDRGAEKAPAGSMLFSFKLSVGSVAFLEKDAYTNEAIAAFLPNSSVDLKFWQYAAPIFISQYGRENIYGALLLNQELIGSVRFFAPPYPEQTQIARFLDHQTARIDALIAEQQRLIELLKEKRQAVISHAVTKGLGPDVAMKDSGVEWLGEVPAHWQIKRLKHVTSAIGGSTPSKDRPEFWGGSIPWVSPKDMKVKVINQTIDQITEEAVLENNLSLAEPGMVLIVVRGMILAHSLPLAITGSEVALNQDMKALKAEKFINSEYLFDILSGIRDIAFEFVDSSAHGTRRLEWERFREILLPIPPLSEQGELSYRINLAKGEIDQLSQEARRAIELLQERRSALISAAVTGKIDARDWQPQSSDSVSDAFFGEGATA